MSKLKNTAKKLSDSESMTDGSMKPQYSAISKYSTVTGTPKAIREWLMSSRADSPAKICHAPEKAKESTAKNPVSGLKWLKPYASFDPDTFSLRTSQRSLFGDSIKSLVRFSKWGLMQGGELFRLPMSERVTSENDCGLWASPAASDGNRSGRITENMSGKSLPQMVNTPEKWPTPNRTDYKGIGQPMGRRPDCDDDLPSRVNRWPTPHKNCSTGAGSQGRDGGLNLQTAIKFPTPRSTDGSHGGPNQRGSKGDHALPGAVFHFPTPSVACATGGQTSRGGKRKGELLLAGFAKKFPTPDANAYKSGERGTGTGGGAQLSNQNVAPGAIGQLNPDWTEWLIGWPVCWTCLEPLDELRWEPVDQEPLDIPRVATKIKNRVNRLKAIGNGQVPHSAALAWGHLKGWK